MFDIKTHEGNCMVRHANQIRRRTTSTDWVVKNSESIDKSVQPQVSSQAALHGYGWSQRTTSDTGEPLGSKRERRPVIRFGIDEYCEQ